MAEERAGVGAEAVETYAMQYVAPQEVPDGVANTIGWFGPNERGDAEVEAFWDEADLVQCPPGHPLFTGQKHISPTAVLRSETPGEASFELPHLLRVDGRDWVIDGHHRLARARRERITIPAVRVEYETAVADGWFDAFFDVDA
jgi:hypothetical protein